VKLRTAKGKLKIEHSIIPRVRGFLELLLENNPDIRSIIPGRISQVRDARGPVKVRVTVPTSNGWKAIALSGGARQELFISTPIAQGELEEAIRKVLVEMSRSRKGAAT